MNAKSKREIRECVVNEYGEAYFGEWLIGNDEEYGRGLLVTIEGSILEGYFVNGQMNGFGRFISNNGWSYEGNFKDQKFDG